MTQVGFREYDVEPNDFLIHITVEADSVPLVALEVTFLFRSRGETARVIEQKLEFQTETPTRKGVVLGPPADFVKGDILFTVAAAFPPDHAESRPYTLRLAAAGGQAVEDEISPDSSTPVFANYAMHLR